MTTTIRYTDAPEDYDGFGTHTTQAEYATLRKGRVLRQVEIDHEYLDWQSMRYQSGIYLCIAEEQLTEMVELLGDKA